ncbi:MAG: hypothetical protein IPO40_04540 [Fibrobacteres bacterium]|nr:hypothetical protein [Fibrobacterota bacterium]
MTRTRTLLALACALLFSCSDDDRVAGGSGTHLPQPTARLLDTNLQPLHAEVWRLWRLDGDVAVPTQQIVNPNGFLVPDEGQWIVEAWRDTAHAGALDGLSNTQAIGMDSCIKALTYLPGTESDRVGVMACRDLASPTSHSRAGGSPLGVGVFGTQSPIQQIVRVPKSNGTSDSRRFLVWRIDLTDTTRDTTIGAVHQAAQVKVKFEFNRTSEQPGLVDVSLRKGDWLFVGWGGGRMSQGDSALWKNPPVWKWAKFTELKKCFSATGACPDQPMTLSGGPDTAEAADYFVVRVP